MASPRVVLACTDSVACEFAGRVAVDAGCEVFKLEPAGGDPLRERRGLLADWLLAGKRSLLQGGADGLDDGALAALIAQADAVLVDEAASRRLAPALSERAQGRVVLVGERDAAVLQGMAADHGDEFLAFHGSGLGFITPRVMPGYPSREPLCPRANLLEFLAGLHGAIALFALLAQVPDSTVRSATVGLCGSALPLLRREISALLLEGAQPHRNERIWKVSPAEVHRCRDGWLFVDVIEDVQWVRLCEWMGMPELGADARYTNRDARFAQAETLCAILDRFFADKPQSCWLDAQRHGVPVAPVNDLHDLVADPQLQARGFWGSAVDAQGAVLRVPLTPLARLFGSGDAPLRVPAVGEHTGTVLVDEAR